MKDANKKKYYLQSPNYPHKFINGFSGEGVMCLPTHTLNIDNAIVFTGPPPRKLFNMGYRQIAIDKEQQLINKR